MLLEHPMPNEWIVDLWLAQEEAGADHGILLGFELLSSRGLL